MFYPDPNMLEPNQAQWIRDYNDRNRQQFNPDLFYRDDNEIIDALKKVILSCQRDSYFTIKVENFKVIDEYSEVISTLYDHEQEKIDRNKNNKKMENIYQYIDLKDSDIMLLVVDYYVSVNDGIVNPFERFKVIIQIPKIVEKYYYRISGNLYSAIYQIVDGSTYNNSASNSKKQSVTSKTVFMPMRLYREIIEDFRDYTGEPHKYIYYQSRLFSKQVPIMEYFLAKFGLYGTLEFLELTFIDIYDQYVEDPERYVFNSKNIFISVPKEIMDTDIPTQCFVLTLVRHLDKRKGDVSLHQLKTVEYWVEVLAGSFSSKAYIEKGYSVLNSLESILDLETQDSIRLPHEDKKDIYSLIRWMLREFPALRLKDITDISTKKVRRAEYIAAMYAAKLSKAIYRASDVQKAITTKDLRRYIYVEPDFLINKIVKDKLVNFRNGVNDNDAINALKFSYKGISGLGEQNTTIPSIFRQVHHSHLKRVDLDTSSASDPGLSGIICPMAPLYNKSFSEYEEPNSWRDDYSTIIETYRNAAAKKQLIELQDSLGNFSKVDDMHRDMIDFSIQSLENAMVAMQQMEDTSELEVAEMDADGVVTVYQ